MSELKKLTKSNPRAAHAILEEAVYRWKDLDALPNMKDLIPQPELANDLVGWINLSYHGYRRGELRAMATEVVK